MLQIYNTLTKRKETFTPIDPQNVRMYVCGMTVYDYCHIGHARVLVVFDIVARYLRHVYGDKQVVYVRNVTDIDDKIIKRANENNEEISVLTSRFIDEMNLDAGSLNVIAPDEEPLATAHMDEIIAMIEQLVNTDHAYQAENNDVYYAINSFADYGKLSGKQLDELRAGERVEVDQSKRNPLDFVLWKSVKPEEPSWPSPWGPGRPGWHIECSAMSTHCLGNHFDIHGGGMDLQFPHHENEIAQSEAATGETFANVWMHNGFVRVDDEKMSKSLDNFFTIREVLKKYDAEVVRFFILSSHYRSPLNYSDKHLDNAKASLTTLYNALRDIKTDTAESGKLLDEQNQQRFQQAMEDDFNTPQAISELFNLATDINTARLDDPDKAAALASQLKQQGALLGLLERDADVFLKSGVGESSLSDEQIDNQIEQRNQARTDKDWAESDRIRDELKEQGITLEDAAGKTTWRRT